jgi:polyhydroxyalkanoate synthesis regulator phasin
MMLLKRLSKFKFCVKENAKSAFSDYTKDNVNVGEDNLALLEKYKMEIMNKNEEINRLKYRITILLREIEKLENKVKGKT